MKKRSFLLIFCLLFSFSSLAGEKYAVKVGNISVSPTEAYVYILNAEEEYAGIVDYYDAYLGIDYWSMEYPNGMTVSQMVKSDVFKEILMMNVFYSMALQKHLSLTRSEKEACREDAESTYALLPVSTAELIEKDELAKVFEKQRLADRMYSMLLSDIEIDEESVIAAVDIEKYKIYEVEYLFRSLTDYTDGAPSREISPEKERDVMEAFENAKKAPSLKEAADAYSSSGILYASAVFSSDDDEIEKTLIDEVRRLSPGETGQVIKTDYGLFLIRLIDDSGKEAYEAAVAGALRQAREEAFSPEYNRMFLNAEYEINVSFWDAIMPGMMKNPD